MSRNLSMAMGRHPSAPRTRSIIHDVVEAFSVIAAAGRVGAAVESHRAPSGADLERSGLAGIPALRGPYRF